MKSNTLINDNNTKSEIIELREKIKRAYQYTQIGKGAEQNTTLQQQIADEDLQAIKKEIEQRTNTSIDTKAWNRFMTDEITCEPPESVEMAIKATKEYFNQSSICYYIPSDYSPPEDEDNKEEKEILNIIKLLPKTESTLVNIEFRNRLEEITPGILYNALSNDQEEQKRIYIYINRAYIENKQGVEDLISILREKVMRTLIDADIYFLYDRKEVVSPKEIVDPRNGNKKITYSILKTEGQSYYIKFWKDRANDITNLYNHKEVSDDVFYSSGFKREVDAYQKIFSNIFITLLTLAEIYLKDIKYRNKKELLKLDTFIPFITTIKNIIPEDIHNIYKKGPNQALRNKVYLGVISYEKFFRSEERTAMLEYFSSFNQEAVDNNGKIIRLFSVRGKRVKRKGWYSQLSEEQNKLIYQYALINILTKAETYLQLYDQDNHKNERDILYEQDYVIKINCENKDEEVTLESILHGDFYPNFDDSLLNSNIVQSGDDEYFQNELFHSYPKSPEIRVNRMIRIGDKDDIIRYFEDFKRRSVSYRASNEKSKKNNNSEVVSLTNRNIQEAKVLSYFNLNHLKAPQLAEMKGEVEMVIKETNSGS